MTTSNSLSINRLNKTSVFILTRATRFFKSRFTFQERTFLELKIKKVSKGESSIHNNSAFGQRKFDVIGIKSSNPIRFVAIFFFVKRTVGDPLSKRAFALHTKSLVYPQGGIHFICWKSQ